MSSSATTRPRSSTIRASAELQRIRQIVGDQDDGDVEPPEDMGELASRSRIEVGRGLVEHEHVGIHRQHRRQCDSSALAEAEVVWGAVGVVVHADCAERRGNPSVELVAGDSEVGRTERHVLAHRGHEELVVGVLEDDPHSPTDLAEVRLGHGQAADADVALLGCVDAVEVQDQGGLAGTIRTEHGDALAIGDDEIHAVECRVPVGIGEGDVAEMNCRGAHGAIQAHTAMVVAATAGSRHANHRAGASSSASDGIEPLYPRDSIAR